MSLIFNQTIDVFQKELVEKIFFCKFNYLNIDDFYIKIYEKKIYIPSEKIREQLINLFYSNYNKSTNEIIFENIIYKVKIVGITHIKIVNMFNSGIGYNYDIIDNIIIYYIDSLSDITKIINFLDEFIIDFFIITYNEWKFNLLENKILLIKYNI